MGKELFGTDGIRGVAGEYPLDERTVFAAGLALGRFVSHLAEQPEVVIGIDTRESGPWLAETLAGGLQTAGVQCRFAGLITTPGVAWLARTGPFVAGIMISASHNAYADNGIKVFSHTGYKFPDDDEHTLEQDIFALLGNSLTPRKMMLPVDPGLDETYLEYLLSTVQYRLDGLRIVVDCANGAASTLGPQLFSRLGAQTLAIACHPNGRNINEKCGALHLDHLRDAVLAAGADGGVAFDGDADRAMFCTAAGKIVDGDAVLYLTGRHLLHRGRLGQGGDSVAIVATTMSNLGLEKALERDGIQLLRTAVGDKYVLEEMCRRNLPLGGEQSGHIIFHDYATTGDGLLTALRVFEVLFEAGESLDSLTSGLELFPQKLVNVRVQQKRPLDQLPAVNDAIGEAVSAFGDQGRVFVRFSGTEPLARVMVEGRDAAMVDHYSESIAAVIRAELGAGA